MAHNLEEHHATSTQSNSFYENTVHSNTSSAKKRKSIISSQSTGSSNEVYKSIKIIYFTYLISNLIY